MCGVAGFLDLARDTGPDRLRELAATMAGTLAHRGPDDAGTWVDAAAGVALGHRRLSIVDVSGAGAQPMLSASGRIVASYNGELYDTERVASELAARGHRFRGHCDTEVLVEAIDEWGVEGAVERCNGMFAFAAWDRDARRLHLARDRIGEKPMYYGWSGNTLLFGSELKALRAHPTFRGNLDRDALALYLRFAYVPSPRSIFSDVKKLPPATVLTVDPTDHPREAAPVPYWSVFATFEAEPTHPSDDEAVERLDGLLRDAVRSRMRSDVPLGAFLSGGIDSSLVVAMMQDQADEPIRTFTIGTTSRVHNEADAAYAVATHLGTRHTELLVRAEDAQAVIPRLPVIYDEPFADESQIPTLLVSELARESVTVSLSGDGGDEVFAGYNRYRAVPRSMAYVRGLPPSFRSAASRAMLAVPPRTWELLVRTLPATRRPRIPATKIAKLATIATLDDPESMYARLVTRWDDAAEVVIGARPTTTTVDDRGGWPGGSGIERRMMALDTVTYLPDDILVKLDRATMSVGLEGRVPLLDHRVVEHAATLPIELHVRDGVGKWLLRQVLHRYVPSRLVDRPKTGFGVPLGAWLRGPLRGWADALLDPQRLRRDGLLRPEPIARMWAEHRAQRRDHESELWTVLMLQAWLEATLGGPAAQLRARA